MTPMMGPKVAPAGLVMAVAKNTLPVGDDFDEGVDDEEVGHQAEDEGHGDRYRADSRYVIEP